MNKQHILKERFDFKVEQEGQNIKKEFDLDSNASYLIGIVLVSDFDELLYYRGSQRILINDKTLFPEGYESRLLMSGLNVSPNDRMVEVGEIETGNGKLEISYQDTPHTNTNFQPYRVSIYAYALTENNQNP
jgi:hypothetical protein